MDEGKTGFWVQGVLWPEADCASGFGVGAWSFVEFAASGWTRNFGFGVFVLCNWGVDAFSTYTLAPYS